MSLPPKPCSLLQEVALPQPTLHLQGAAGPAEPAADRIVPEPPSCVFRLCHSDQIYPRLVLPPPPSLALHTPRRLCQRCLLGNPGSAAPKSTRRSSEHRPTPRCKHRRPLIFWAAGFPQAKDRQTASNREQTNNSQSQAQTGTGTGTGTGTDTYQNQPNNQRLAALRCDAASRTLLGLR